MKHSRLQRSSGSVLLATMGFVLAIAAFMVAYLYVVQNSNRSVSRAQAWNSALAITEAGIEEGLANLNQVAITTNPIATTFNPFSHNLNGGTYYVSSSAAGVVSTITSTGVVSAPLTGDAIPRAVRITAQRQALFSKGMVSMTTIDMKGNGVISDSYNSTNGPYSSAPHGANGDVAALNGVVNIGNHTIDGNLYLGPNSTYSPPQSGQGGVTGTVYQDWNMQFPDAFLPTNDINGNLISWTPAPITNSGPSTIDHIFTNSGYYSITDNGNIIVAAGITVTLDVKQFSYDLSKATITIYGGTTNAGSVIMYQESGSVTLGGTSSGGAFNNPPTIPSNRPENFVYFGLPGVTSIKYNGSSDFVGVIYAPEADLELKGGGSGVNFSGSLIVKSLTIDGNYNIHYDTSLLGYYYGYYVAGSWQEL